MAYAGAGTFMAFSSENASMVSVQNELLLGKKLLQRNDGSDMVWHKILPLVSIYEYPPK